MLNGLWFGSSRAATVLIFVHGLGGSAFSRVELVEKLAIGQVACLTFSNRGSGVITRFKKLNAKKPSGYESQKIGMAHEVFTDCIDDLDGAINVAKQMGAKRIILVGHSTGCQKSVYYLAHRPSSVVKGVVLLAPMSDYADMVKATSVKDYKRLVVIAQKLALTDHAHELMPNKLWPFTVDAQRFLSLFTAGSVEEIFGYATNKKPTLLNKVKTPILVALAEQDEFRERPMSEIADWFSKALSRQKSEVHIVPEATHGFFEATEPLSKLIKTWLKKR